MFMRKPSRQTLLVVSLTVKKDLVDIGRWEKRKGNDYVLLLRKQSHATQRLGWEPCSVMPL